MLVARLVAFAAVNIQAIMGHGQNELRNAAGLILKLRVIVAVQDMKIGLYMYILVPPHFWLVPPHFVCSGDGTAGFYLWFKSIIATSVQFAACALRVQCVNGSRLRVKFNCRQNVSNKESMV